MLRHILTLACFSVLVPLGIGIKNFWLYSADRKALTFFVFLSAVVGITTFYMWQQHQNNLPLLHAYTVIEFIFISYIYSLHIGPIIPRKVIYTLAAVFICFSVYNSFFIQSFYQFNNYARGIEFIMILCYSIVYVYSLFAKSDISPLRTMPMFWFNTGVLLYYTTSFFVFLLSNNMLMDLSKSTIHISWAFHGVFLIIYHAFLSIALWINPKD